VARLTPVPPYILSALNWVARLHRRGWCRPAALGRGCCPTEVVLGRSESASVLSWIGDGGVECGGESVPPESGRKQTRGADADVQHHHTGPNTAADGAHIGFSNRR
jgi:hypothetical protein